MTTQTKKTNYTAGRLKLRFPFIHYRIEYQGFIQGAILLCAFRHNGYHGQNSGNTHRGGCPHGCYQ